MSSDVLNIIIAAGIMALFLLAWFWETRRKAEQNPVGTGQVKEDVHRIRQRLGEIESDMQNMKGQMRDHATRSDLSRIEEMMRGHAKLAQRTDAKIDRIETFMIQKSLGVK